MSFLRIEGLAKRFGDFVAVKDFHLDVERGEFVSLLGPSGCGKTTTLQMIAGFLDPSQGRIVLDGKDITQLRPEQRGMGVVFQSYALFPHMTVEQNISFGLEMRKLSRDVVQQLSAVSKALDRAGFLVISTALRECLNDPEAEDATDPDELEKLFLTLA